MDLMKIGTQLLMRKMVGGNAGNAVSALSGLLGGGSGDSATPDLGGLLSKMQGNETGGDITELAASWLGKGDNEKPSLDQLKNIFGSEKIAALVRMKRPLFLVCKKQYPVWLIRRVLRVICSTALVASADKPVWPAKF